MEAKEYERIYVKNARKYTCSLLFPLLRTFLNFMAHDKIFICLQVQIFLMESEVTFSEKTDTIFLLLLLVYVSLNSPIDCNLLGEEHIRCNFWLPPRYTCK